ncbi:MAG: InlB B-repeat-containing protein [Erysipelotrichaceae bacterium]|nr:InlB B-repeat-containing protein [Erysipelotrichaceae bacterium]
MKRCIIRLLSILLFCSSLISTRIVYAEEDQTDLASITTVEQDPVTGNLLITSENREWLNEIYALKNAGYDWSKTIYFSTGERINYNNRWSPVVFESDDEGICGITITHDALLYHEVASGDTVITFPATDSFENFSLELQDLDACMEMTDNVAVHMDDEKNLIIEVDDCAWAEEMATWDSNMKDINNHISLDSSSAHFDIWSDGYSFIYENGIVTVQNFELVSRGVSDGIYDLIFHVYGYVPYRLDADLSISGIIKERTAELSVTAETGDLVITCGDADFLDGIMRYNERYSDENGNQIRYVPGGRVNIDLENGSAELRNDRGHRPDGSTWENDSFHRDGNTIVVYNETLKNWGNLYDTDSARVRVHSYGYSEETINNVIIRNIRSEGSPLVSVVQDEDTHDLLITSGNRQWLNEMYELSLDRPGGSSLSDFRFSTGQIITYTGRYSDNFTNIVYTRDQDGVNGITIKYNALLDSNVESGNSTLFLPRTASFPGISIEIENLVACEDAPEDVRVHLDENNNLIITPGDSQWADRLVNWDGYGDFTNHIDLVGSGSYGYMIKINKYYATLEENQITVPEYLLVSAAIPDGIYDLDFYLYGYAVLHLDADIEVTGIMKELREEVSVTAENGDLVITCYDEDFLEGIEKYTEYYNQTQKRIPGGFVDVFIQNPDNSSGYLYSAYAPFNNVKTYDDGGTYERTELSRVNNSVVVSNKRLKTTNLHNTDSARVEIHAYGYQPVVIENVIIRNVRRTDVPDDVSVTIDANGDFIINSQNNKDWLEKLCEYSVEPDYSSFGKIILLQFDERNQRYEQKGQLIYYFYYFDGEKVVLEADKLIHSGIPSGTYRLKFAAEGYMDLDTELEITIVGTKEKPDDIAVRLDENGDLIIYLENGEDEEYLANIAKQGSYDGNEPIEVGGEVILKNNNVQEWISNARQPGMIVYDEENNITRVRFSVYKFPYLSGNHIVSIFSAGYGSVYKANNDYINLEIFLPFINESFATNLIVGDSVQYTVNTDKNISWSTDDVDVASVDENGLLTAKKAGTVHLNMQVEGYEYVDSLEITISKNVKFAITYGNMLESDENPNPEYYIYDETDVITLQNAFRNGYNFLGWFTLDGTNGKWGTQVKTIKRNLEEPVTVYAKWSPIKYTIKYILNGGTNNKANKTSYTVETCFDLTDPVKKGYAFLGWTDQYGNAVTTTEGRYENLTLTATFASEPTQYEIVLDPMDGTLAAKQSYDARLILQNDGTYTGSYNVTDTTYKLPKLVKDFYKFNGWYDHETEKKVSSVAKGSIGNKDLYANFTPVSYKITYNTNKGKILVKNTKAEKFYDTTFSIETESLDLPVSEEVYRKGYIFKGWYLDKELTVPYVSIEDLELRNTAIYAKWEPITYRIQFVSDQYESEPVTIQYDQSYRIPDDIFHVPGMKVQKYTYMLNGKTVTVAANKTIKNLVSENGTDTIVFRVAKDSNQNELWDIYSPDGKKLPIKNRFGEKVYTYCNTQIPAGLGTPTLSNAQIDELIAMVDSQRGLSPEEVDISVLDEVAARITTLADAACYLQRAKFSFTNKGLANADIFGPDVGNIGFSDDEFLYTIPGAESLLVNEGQCSSSTSLMEYLLQGDYDELGYIKISQNNNGHAMIYILSGDKYYLVDPTEYVYRGGGLWLRFLNADKASSQSLEELVQIVHNANYPTPREPNIKTVAYVYDGVFCMCGEDGWINDPGVNIKFPVGAQVKAFIGFDHPVFAQPQHSTSQSMILGVILR